MKNLTLIIPTKEEAESLPIFLNELKDYNFIKKIVLQKEDHKTIASIKNFEDLEILLQKNSGYGTKKHIEAIKNYGVTEHHRKTFAPIHKILSL